MEPADSIGRLGFRRWYERRLIEGHAWFVTCFLCLIAVAACLEELSVRGSAPRLLALSGIAFAAGATGLFALRRYQRILDEAERVAGHSTCASCGTYGRFTIVGGPLTVRCRTCAKEWRIE